jgi:hypothetical protein
VTRHWRQPGLEKLVEVPQIRVLEQLLRRSWTPSQRTIFEHVEANARAIRRLRFAAIVVVVVRRYLRDVHVDVVDGQSGTLASEGVESLREAPQVVLRERDAKDGRHSLDAAQGVERGHLAAEPPFDSANVVVQPLVAIDADGHNRLAGSSPGDAPNGLHDAVGEKSVGRKVQQLQATPARDHGLEDVVDVRPQKNLAAGQIHPGNRWVPPDERDDLIRGELVGRLALPDIAGLAAVLTPVR